MSYQYQKKCGYDGCEEKGYARGLCEGHYNMARRLVGNGITTWSEMEEKGKVAKLAKCGSKARWLLE